jgi:predicted Kef-type K+ transport protein
MLAVPSPLTTDNISMFFTSFNHLNFTFPQYLPKFVTYDLFALLNNYSYLILQPSCFYLQIPFLTLFPYSSIVYFNIIFTYGWRGSSCTHVSSNSSQFPNFCYHKNKLLVYMYIVKNTTLFLIVRLLLLRYNYMFRPSMLAIFRLYMKHLTISYVYTW